MARRDMVVGVRLTAEDVAKLDQLAAKTYRGRADILRCLISQAVAAEHPDIVLGVSPERREGGPDGRPTHPR